MNAETIRTETEMTIEVEELESKIAPSADSAFLD